MSKFQKLTQINKIANECAQDGDFVLSSKFHNEFMKIAQVQKNEDNSFRANGPAMQKAIMYIQANLGVGEDGMFGPSTSYAIVKALDGISPEQNLDKAYVQRAREFVQSMPAGFVTMLKSFVGMKGAIRELEKVPATRATEIESSDVKMRLIQALGGYKG
jgi:hypothetical protein